MAANNYQETVSDPPWLNRPIYVVVIAVLLVVSVIFAHLQIKVGDESLRFNLGPLSRTIQAGEIVSVEVELYRWLTYGG